MPTPQATSQAKFYAEQTVTDADMNSSFGQLYTHLLTLNKRLFGQGWFWGGNATFTPSTSPPVLTVDNFFGITPAGSTLTQSSGSLNLTLTSNGFTQAGLGGTPDGSAVSPANTDEVWFLVLVHFEVVEDVLKLSNPLTYFNDNISFKFQTIAGSIATGSADAVKPSIPGSGDFLVLCDVLVKNDGSGAYIDQVDYARRSILELPPETCPIWACGYPALVKKVPMTATPVSSDDWTGFFGPDYGDARGWYATAANSGVYGGSGFIHDYFGWILSTWAGGFMYDLTHNGVGSDNDDGFVAAFFVINKGESDVTVTPQMRQDSGGAMGYSLVTGPFEVADGWAADSTGSTLTLDWSPSIVLKPGRSLIRFFWSRRNGDKLTAAITDDWLNDNSLKHDVAGIRNVIQRGNYELLFTGDFE